MILFRNSPPGFLAFQVMFFIAAYLVAWWQHKPGLAAWGLNFKKGTLTQLLLGMLLGIALYGATFLCSLLLGSEKVLRVPALSEVWMPFGLFVLGNLFSSFSEDLLTRGYVYQHLQGRLHNRIIALISATVYLLNHIYRLDDGPLVWSYLFLLGILYVIPLLLTRRLWFTGGMHWAGNLTFFYCHEIITSEETGHGPMPNLVFVVVILLVMPLTYYCAQGMQRHKATV
ncbi:CAAX protease self-immunity [Cnuella takakiae]|uniref:CAAX protease self-immunity n=1 Tax=Cnuella takakiae TaxID=1302690 RepID=A0A1M5I6A0_9BACT|nr:CPBP family intramembrane glutamic endopeptidase [Cnuella takakiae]OLY93194.1 hypothetical protein BUE76_15830 [Cnuella takakiae]SHG23878.1 CAAX protease self-immunity [Cnuella takakiae]